MSTAYEIPLTPQPQTFAIALAGVDYRITVYWCNPIKAWVFDLAKEDATPILQGIAIVTGVDLLSQFGYLGIGGQLIAQTDHDTDAVPTYDNLGVSGHLYFVVED